MRRKAFSGRAGGSTCWFGALLFTVLSTLSPISKSIAEDAKTFGRWTSGSDLSVPGEKLCWLANGELVFVIWVVEEDDYRGEWLTNYAEEGALEPHSFLAEVGGKVFSGEGSVGGPDLVQEMKAGTRMDYQFENAEGSKRGSISLIGFTKGYRYCEGLLEE